MTGRCVFCLANGHVDDAQILARGEHAYVFAPRGPLVPGHLIIAPYDCIGCLARAPAACRAEVEELRASLEHGHGASTFYEQGRAGGGAVIDGVGGFPHHAHLCCLPLEVDLRGALGREYRELGVEALDTLRTPYVYLQDADGSAVYVPAAGEQVEAMERLRLRKVIAQLVGQPERGDWRDVAA